MVRKLKNKKKGDVALKKVRLKFQMLSAELLEAEIILDECMLSFNERFETGAKPKISEGSQEMIKKEEGSAFNQNQKKKEKERERNKIEHKEILPKDKDVGDLFKKIALKTHPDKLREEDEEDAEYLIELYKEAANAAENGDGMTLLEIAYELDINVKIDPKKEINWLNKKIDSLTGSIEEVKQAAEWVWFHSSGAERLRVEKMIAGQLGFKIKTTSLDKSDE